MSSWMSRKFSPSCQVANSPLGIGHHGVRVGLNAVAVECGLDKPTLLRP